MQSKSKVVHQIRISADVVWALKPHSCFVWEEILHRVNGKFQNCRPNGFLSYKINGRLLLQTQTTAWTLLHRLYSFLLSQQKELLPSIKLPSILRSMKGCPKQRLTSDHFSLTQRNAIRHWKLITKRAYTSLCPTERLMHSVAGSWAITAIKAMPVYCLPHWNNSK